MRIPAILLISLFFLPVAIAQVQIITPDKDAIIGKEVFNPGVRSASCTSPVIGENASSSNSTKWCFAIKNFQYSIEHSDPEAEAIKEKKNKLKNFSGGPRDEEGVTTADPIISTNFEGNWMTQHTPSDNTFAISKSGNIVSANNDDIEYYNSGGYISGDFWTDFYSGIITTGKIFDPKLIYDTEKDRFVLIVLNGNNSSQTNIVLGISKSNNPQVDGWYFYTINGHPNNVNYWCDYPNVGISNSDIFITGNQYTDDGTSHGAIIYQIDKTTAYNKQSLEWYYYSELSSDPIAAFTLLPASYGQQGNYGPGFYFVNGKSGGSDKYRLWYITDSYNGNPQLQSFTVAATAYSPAANCGQYGTTDKLDGGDCRLLNAFYLNGIVHFVHMTDLGDGWNGINYCRLNVQNLTNTSSTFGLKGSYDYTYPAVASFGKTVNDKAVIIGFQRGSTAIYPEYRVVHCDDNMDWSGSKLVHIGEDYVNLLAGDVERWGDYTGICRRNNGSQPRVWITGSYGADIASQNTTHSYRSWIAEVYSFTTATNEVVPAKENTRVFPNPVIDNFTYQFELNQIQDVEIVLIDQYGKLIRTFYKGSLDEGKQELSFNKGNLVNGVYYLQLKGKDNYEKSVKIIISK